MHKLTKLTACLLLGVLAACTSTPPPSNQTVADLEAQYEKALSLISGNDKSEAAKILRPIAESPAFPSLSEPTRHSVYALLARSAAAMNDAKEADKYVRPASEMPSATFSDWDIRLQASTIQKNLPDMLLSLETLARRWPQSLADLNDYFLFSVLNHLNAHASSDQNFEVMDALFEAHWKPSNASLSADYFWLRLALLEIERRHEDRAYQLALAIRKPSLVVQIRADKRFDALVALSPASFDPREAAIRSLAEARKRVSEHPDDLDAINHLAHELRYLSRNEEALKILSDAVARALPQDGSASRLTRLDKLNWTLNQKMNALLELGRVDEAIEAGYRAAQRPEQGQDNISQVLNLGEMLFEVGRPKEALDEISWATQSRMSPYGQLTASSIKACAAAELGDAVLLSQSIEAMSEDIADTDTGSAPYEEAFLCADRPDLLADFYIKRLSDPKTRGGLLGRIQIYTLFHTDTDFEAILEKRRNAVLEREDVKAALDKVGRRLSWPLVGTSG